MITLPEKDTDHGAESRLLLAECRGPSLAGYNLADARTCMQLMHLVLWNRVKDPGPFLAKAKTLVAVITAKGQFRGFEPYPDFDPLIANNIQQMIEIANNQKDKRSGHFADFLNTALSVAAGPIMTDPSKGALTAWRTAGSGSPGSHFKLHQTVLGTDFYFV